MPILTIISGLDLKEATSLTAFMVTGVSVANVFCNLLSTSPKNGARTLMDFDIALELQPSMFLGVSVGVICNLVFPEWLITILFVVFLAWSTSKTCKTGMVRWEKESERLMRRNGSSSSRGESEDHDLAGSINVAHDHVNDIDEKVELLLGAQGISKLITFPWMKLVLLVLVWRSFCFLYLLRRDEGRQVECLYVHFCYKLEYYLR
ncbi:hypothetical protein FEM48_Zijuj11G0004400 [Ziziphus jujuba var. spinosa]|uniref:Uncharacterized protein n=1 Tax=Ziziphus jujuba var. spinosa TaxID=714518 RepID=A0A978UFS7_ZIZJJ|nr:hypothetical protein FEM48_Zijuj11G0004400 [Ziziphus jujuba var. spinosa]